MQPVMQPVLREEQPGDRPVVRQILIDAFEGAEEADLVEELRRLDAVSLALVAEIDGRLVGHVLFSPVTIEGLPDDAVTIGLAPLAVLTSHQRAGIGMALTHEGLRRGRKLGWQAVVVLGHADYYPRFGFGPAHGRGLRCEFPSPPEAFMVLELVDGALDNARGLVRYHPAFGGGAA